MGDKRKRRKHKCPRCKHEFKNFKWDKCWKYDGVCARCPKCNYSAHEWQKTL